MSALSQAKSPEAIYGVKLITLYNADLPASQSQQSFRVQPNTSVFDLINHLKKIYRNKEIQLFIQQNQLFKGNLNTFLFPILQQLNIRTIQFKVIGENPLLQTFAKTPLTINRNENSQFNYTNQNTNQHQEYNQNWLFNQNDQKSKINPYFAMPQQSQTNQQQILHNQWQFNGCSEQISRLSGQPEREKEQQLKQIFELKQNNNQLQHQSTQTFDTASELIEKSSTDNNNGLTSYFGKPSLQSTNYQDQSKIQFVLNCSHRIQKIELEQQLANALYSYSFATCSECSKLIGLGICRQLGQDGLTYLDYKCNYDLKSIQTQIHSKGEYYLYICLGCRFFFINTLYLQDMQGFCPQCLELVNFKSYPPLYNKKIKLDFQLLTNHSHFLIKEDQKEVNKVENYDFRQTKSDYKLSEEIKKIENQQQELNEEVYRLKQMNSQYLQKNNDQITELKQVKSQLDELKKQNYELQNTIKLQAQLAEENKEISLLLTQNEQLHQKNNLLNQRNKIQEQQLSDLIEQYSKLKTEKREMEKLIEKQDILKVEKIELENLVKEIKQKYEELQQSQVKQNEYSSNTIQSLKKEIQVYQGKLQKLEISMAQNHKQQGIVQYDKQKQQVKETKNNRQNKTEKPQNTNNFQNQPNAMESYLQFVQKMQRRI